MKTQHTKDRLQTIRGFYTMAFVDICLKLLTISGMVSAIVVALCKTKSKRRTMRDKYNKLVTNDKVEFYFVDNCGVEYKLTKENVKLKTKDE